MYMDNILHEAFVNMFQENPDLKEKFIASKENAANGRRRKYICNLINFMINNSLIISRAHKGPVSKYFLTV